MSQVGVIQIIALLAWLVLAGSALASYRLGWKEGLRLALVWAGLFAGAVLLISLIMG